ncbi:hypothetical protein I4I73_28585 [Pseudonocardia sp. KRD-184]|uniref:Uncharacterized protein n=1 Tax=Pseudonocardia oceani TaxID=2792013 RepID=A0ABS6U3X0_9PSEU|nr:hypothetical protein [Pseudonocardia oceani]MBW0093786.1 hypothetical protein [Pseudonocardia oceani]MBW0099946.1 hypothetical protein [Pseudonocardia oceani]MBW0113161.1 hypothetical protein [Pseudonocardia oceani]MBW0125820.1 hypothetical protein [Pseudonocardia oceani]MBW0126925.1 hypothetical protein [Pseudonocardia oceani]
MNGTPIHPVHDGIPVADITERLMAEFGAVVPLTEVSAVVMRAVRDLAGVPVGALPELVERLARQVLRESGDAG